MKVTLLLLAALLAGCAANPPPLPFSTPVFVPPTAPDKGKATLVLYRQSEKPLVDVPTLMVNGRVLFAPSERDYTWVHLPAGTHRVVVDWPVETERPDLAFEVELIEGSPLYLKLSSSYQRRDVPHMGGF